MTTATPAALLVSKARVAFPDGPERLAWPGITYLRVRPTWIRYSDFRPASARIVELDPATLA